MAVPGTVHFTRKKQAILEQLALPDQQYTDLSPKGSVDEGIKDLINEVNAYNGFVTTSSCAGRISVFLEGKKISTISQSTSEDRPPGESFAGPGGKGGGGKWLFISHDPVNMSSLASSGTTEDPLMRRFGMVPSSGSQSRNPTVHDRFIHLKFEPMILHVLTASLPHGQMLLSASLQAGFRESGAVSIEGLSGKAATPMVAVRSTGLMFDCIIGYASYEDNAQKYVSLVTENYLQLLVRVANERFKINTERINRFRDLFREKVAHDRSEKLNNRMSSEGHTWEDPASRRERKKAEGLRQAAEVKRQVHNTDADCASLSLGLDPFLD